MKKIALGIVAAGITVLGLSAGVVAAGADISTVKAEQKGTSVSFAGTADAGVLAATCELLDKNGNEIAINSVAVNDAKFSGDFTLGSGVKAATIRCANYSGGSWATAEVVVIEDNTFIPKAPDTGIAR